MTGMDDRLADRLYEKVIALSRANGLALRAFDRDEVLLQSGLLDSATLIEYVVWIENEFDITIEQEELTVENFGSINQIAAFVDARRKSAA